MRNHNQKIKDMCESVLPSASRKNARERRRIAHGAERAMQRAALRSAATGQDYERRLGDADRRRRAAIREMVLDRRAADKVAPLVRWARVTVERDPRLRNAPPEDVVAHFAALLPDDLIGRHAVQHIVWGLRLERDGWLAGAEARWEAQKAAAAAERARYQEAVIALVRSGRHGDINLAVRAVRRAQIAQLESAGKPVDGARLVPFLPGAHAVDAFVGATRDNPKVRAAVLQIES